MLPVVFTLALLLHHLPQNRKACVGFEVLTVMVMKSTILEDITLCNALKPTFNRLHGFVTQKTVLFR
jgi:hypothetical protein